ncbi:MAG TPA: VOC family protein [Candidatus Limnocylindria bacterium]|jgi:catechol 2,3-dioxygenase-like lactoylglutathione lyase family enzyme
MKVLFVAGFGPIVRDMDASLAFYRDTIGMPLEEKGDVSTEKVDGVKHFGLWPLAEAAESCFGSHEWPTNMTAPQAWIEFDVDDVAAAAEELRAKGYRLLVAPKTEPWGQTVARLLSPEGVLVGVTITPWMREPTKASGG